MREVLEADKGRMEAAEEAAALEEGVRAKERAERKAQAAARTAIVDKEHTVAADKATADARVADKRKKRAGSRD